MKSVRWVLAAIVAGLLMVSGCSIPGANVAATVNGVDIPGSQIEGAVAAIGSSPGQLAEPHAIVLTWAIRGEVARTIAAEQNIQLTGEPRTTLMHSNPNLEQYAKTPGAADFVNDLIDATLVVNKVGEPAFVVKLAETQVQVNPRFGAWSAQTASVDQTGGQLSQPWTVPSNQPR
ncbi:MAG: hypothetical protein QM695_11110 [Micropruina sp.]